MEQPLNENYETYNDGSAPSNEVFIDSPPEVKPVAQKLTNGINQAIATVGTNTDTVQAFSEGFLNASSSSVVDNVDQHVATSVKRVVGLAGKVPPEAIAKEVKKRTTEAKDNTLLGKYKAFIRANPNSEKLTKEQIGEAASSVYLRDLMAQVHDSTTTSEKMTDFAQNFLLSTDNVKMKAVADYFGLPFEKTQIANKGDFVRKFADSVRRMEPESKAHIYKKLVDNWETMGGFNNKAELITFLGRLESMNDDENDMLNLENFGSIMDAASAATLGVSKLVGGVAKGVTTLTKLATGAPKASAFSKTMNIAEATKSVAKTIIDTNNPMHTVAMLGDVDATADVVQAGARGELKVAGVNPLDAANAMLPFDTIKKLTPGAPKDVAHSILERQKVFDEIASNEAMGLPMSDAERTAQIDKIMAKVGKQDEVASVRVVAHDGRKVTLEAKTHLGEDVVSKHEFQLSDVGTWTDLRYRHAGKVGSPKFKLPGIATDLVDRTQYGIDQGAKLRSRLDNIVTQSFKGADSEKVMDLIKHGSETQKVFSYTEAVDVGVNGVKLSPKDFEAYATVRQAFDASKRLKESEILSKWKIRNIKHFDLNGQKMAGKVYEASQDAIQGFEKGAQHSKWYIKDGKMVNGDLTPKIINDAYGQGYKLVRANPTQLYRNGHNAAEWVLAKTTDITNPVGPIINDIPGYVTRINENANFFLKKQETFKIGDKEVKQWVTVGYGNLYTDVDDFRKAKYGNDPAFKVFADRELSSGALDDDVVDSMGGLFTGSRSSTPLPYLSKGEAKQAGILESLQRYINHVASNQPISIHREGLKQKWIDTAVENGMLPGYKGYENFAELAADLNPKNENYFFFKRSHDEILAATGLRTIEEIEMTSRLTAIGRWAEGKPFGKPVASFFYNGRVQQIDNAIASATYHSMMGIYNLAHPFIQFSGSIVPLAANPISGMKGLWGAMEMTVLDYMAKFGKINGMPTKKLDMNMWELWRESGFGEGLTHSNLDFARVSGGGPYDQGLMGKMMSKSDVLTLMGEQGYSRVSFATAYHHVASELGHAPTLNDIEKISARAHLYKMNMGKANMAGYQKDTLLKWPGMFMQAQTKFVEKMIGKEFTAMERARIIGGQMAVFGAMGTPFIGSMAPQILAACNVDVSTVETETLAKIHKGVFGWFMSDYLGLKADIAGRMSLGTDFAEKTINMIFADSHPIDALLGARWGMMKNTWNALEKIAMTAKVLYNYDHVTPSLALAAAQVIGEEALQIPSSTRNMIKGYTMYNSKLYKDKNGLPVFYYRDPSLRASIAQSMGFQNEEINDWYTVADGGRIFDKVTTQASYAKMMAGIVTKLIDADADRVDAYAMAYNAMASAALSQVGGHKVLEDCIKYLHDPKETWSKKFIKGMEKYQTEYSEGYEEWMKILNVRSNLAVGRELEKYGVVK